MKVLLVDDHPLILSALQTVIRGFGDDVTVVGVDNERDARKALQRDPDFDLVLLDLHLGETDGFEVLAEFRSRHPALPIVVISASDRASDVIRAIDAGAMGFVPKRTSNEALTEALRLVMAGGIYVPPMSLGLAVAPPLSSTEGDTVPDIMRPRPFDDIEEATEAIAAEAAPAPGEVTPASIEALGLSKRQSEVLLCLLKGMPNKHIARELHLSIDTVKDHVAGVLKALKVSSRTQAVIAISQITQQASRRGAPPIAGWKPSKQ